FFVRLSRTASYRFSSSRGPGVYLFSLQCRSFKAKWITMDPAIVKNVFGVKAPIARVEYRLPDDATKKSVIEIPVRVRTNAGLEGFNSIRVASPGKFQDETFIAGLIQQNLPAILRLPEGSVVPAAPAGEAQSAFPPARVQR